VTEEPPRTPSAWEDALLAMTLFAIDPSGTGVSLRGPAGPVREAWLAALRDALPAGSRLRKMPATIGDEALLGGIDFSATLRAGRKVAQAGLLDSSHGGIVVAAMAERLPSGTVGILAATLDDGVARAARDGAAESKPCHIGLLALDEGIDDERLAPALLDRLAFHLDVTALSHHDLTGATLPDPAGIAAARAMLAAVLMDDAPLQALCGTAHALGAGFVRAPLLALKVARAHAALAGRMAVTMEDASAAARLVLAPRATRLPAEPPDEAEPPPPQPPDEPPPDSEETEMQSNPPEGAEMVLEAAKAAIPPGLLEQLKAVDFSRPPRPGTGKAGARQKGGLRGRPVGVRAGIPGPGQRLNLIETLRAAAPWQPLRVLDGPGTGLKLRIRKDDFRVTRTEQRARSTTIFLVDASGSSALNRLAEAKGAVELLLADCYKRRDEVAVLAFRGQAAQLLLPPTRSLVRAKRSLAGLPGGGGTPLATAIEAGYLLADHVRRAGDTPTLVLMTDGRANVTLAGTGGRAQAEQDAIGAGRRVRAAGLRALFVDISPRPSEQAKRLAGEMGALYVPLPVANAASVSSAVRAASQRP
jgi:magnesium chelatase subunit D